MKGKEKKLNNKILDGLLGIDHTWDEGTPEEQTAYYQFLILQNEIGENILVDGNAMLEYYQQHPKQIENYGQLNEFQTEEIQQLINIIDEENIKINAEIGNVDNKLQAEIQQFKKEFKIDDQTDLTQLEEMGIILEKLIAKPSSVNSYPLMVENLPPYLQNGLKIFLTPSNTDNIRKHYGYNDDVNLTSEEILKYLLQNLDKLDEFKDVIKDLSEEHAQELDEKYAIFIQDAQLVETLTNSTNDFNVNTQANDPNDEIALDEVLKGLIDINLEYTAGD